MKNVTELRNELIAVFEAAGEGKIELPVTKELANVAGKIIKSAAIQLSYNEFMRYDKKKIKFLEGE